MASPWIAESNFELGTNAEWSAEFDTGARLDFPHYSQLASQHTWSSAAPRKGAFCMRVEAGDANPHFVNRTDAIVAITTSSYFKFQFCVGSGWTAGATTNTFTIFRLMGGATTETHASVGLRVGRLSTTSIELGVGTSVPTVFGPFLDLNRWYSIEVQASTAADITTGAVGLNTVYLDGAIGATVAGIQQTVETTVCRLGLMDGIALNQGTLLYDSYIHDDLRIGPDLDYGDTTQQLTRSGHVFVGPGTLQNASLISRSGVATGTVTFYDTDRGTTTSESKIKAAMQATVNAEVIDLAGVPITFNRGCYALITPTAIASTPRLSVSFSAYAESSLSAKRTLGQRVRVKAQDLI